MAGTRRCCDTCYHTASLSPCLSACYHSGQCLRKRSGGVNDILWCGHVQLVQQDLGAVLKLDPGNAEAVRLLEELQQTQQDAKAAEKQLAAGMLAGRQ